MVIDAMDTQTPTSNARELRHRAASLIERLLRNEMKVAQYKQELDDLRREISKSQYPCDTLGDDGLVQCSYEMHATIDTDTADRLRRVLAFLRSDLTHRTIRLPWYVHIPIRILACAVAVATFIFLEMMLAPVAKDWPFAAFLLAVHGASAAMCLIPVATTYMWEKMIQRPWYNTPFYPFKNARQYKHYQSVIEQMGLPEFAPLTTDQKNEDASPKPRWSVTASIAWWAWWIIIVPPLAIVLYPIALLASMAWAGVILLFAPYETTIVDDFLSHEVAAFGHYSDCIY